MIIVYCKLIEFDRERPLWFFCKRAAFSRTR